MVATLPSGLSNSITRVDSESNDVRVRRVIQQKRPTCPDSIETGQKLDEGTSECVTPTKTKSDQGDGELLGDDSSNEKQSKNSDGDESNTDEDEDDEAEQVKLAKD